MGDYRIEVEIFRGDWLYLQIGTGAWCIHRVCA